MIRKLSFKLCFIWVIILGLMSCRDNLESAVNQSQNSKKIDSTILEFTFKDTVNIKSKVKGKLRYNLFLDSISPSGVDKRYTFLYVTTESKITSLEAIEKVNHEIFIDTIGDGTFFFNAIFNEIGNNELNAIIEDKIILKEPLGDGNIQIISKETNITWPVYAKIVKQNKS